MSASMASSLTWAQRLDWCRSPKIDLVMVNKWEHDHILAHRPLDFLEFLKRFCRNIPGWPWGCRGIRWGAWCSSQCARGHRTEIPHRRCGTGPFPMPLRGGWAPLIKGWLENPERSGGFNINNNKCSIFQPCLLTPRYAKSDTAITAR